MPIELISGCFPPAVAERMHGAKRREFSGAVSKNGTVDPRRASRWCPRGRAKAFTQVGQAGFAWVA
jgi:hypothetical protein